MPAGWTGQRFAIVIGSGIAACVLAHYAIGARKWWHYALVYPVGAFTGRIATEPKAA